jgi:DNA-binding CsgD family transcriptional regulator
MDAERRPVMQDLLSDEDRRILTLLAAGMSAKEAARAMKISSREIEFKLLRLRSKTGSRNSTHLVAMFLRDRQLQLPAGPEEETSSPSRAAG